MLDFDTPRFPLVEGPTPLHALPRLSDHLGGPRILIKRDDLQTTGLGGNKLRKLEFHVAAAKAAGATEIITTGALQSNHARLTAAVCARLGLNCHLLLKPSVKRATESYARNGNLVLNSLLGARISFLAADADGAAAMRDHARELEQRHGLTSWIVPMGGSDALGSLGYARAAGEIRTQLSAESLEASAIVLAGGSGGTHAGMLAGMLATGYAGEVHGPCVLEGEAAQLAKVARITAEVLALMKCSREIPPDAVRCEDSQLGDGYGVPTEAMREALALCGRLEGVFLDPVYSGKAMAWLIASAGRWSRDETVVFLHTGGVPGLFAYQDLFTG